MVSNRLIVPTYVTSFVSYILYLRIGARDGAGAGARGTNLRNTSIHTREPRQHNYQHMLTWWLYRRTIRGNNKFKNHNIFSSAKTARETTNHAPIGFVIRIQLCSRSLLSVSLSS